MNDTKRKEIDRATRLLAEATDILNGVVTDEQDALDSVEEHFPGSERADALEESVDLLEDALGALEEVGFSLEEARG